MRKTTNRRVRMAAIAAALATTAGVISAPLPALAASATGGSAVSAVTAADDPNDPQGGEGSTEILTVAEDAELTAAGYGQPVQRDVVMDRAKDWYNRNVAYSQSAYAWDVNDGKKYRTDCSGYVSMVWKLKTSLTTSTLDDVSHVINWDDLLRGDALVWPGHHAMVFDKWVDADTKADIWVYEEGSTASDMNHRDTVHVVSIRNQGYKPYRYDSIRK